MDTEFIKEILNVDVTEEEHIESFLKDRVLPVIESLIERYLIAMYMHLNLGGSKDNLLPAKNFLNLEQWLKEYLSSKDTTDVQSKVILIAEDQLIDTVKQLELLNTALSQTYTFRSIYGVIDYTTNEENSDYKKFILIDLEYYKYLKGLNCSKIVDTIDLTTITT